MNRIIENDHFKIKPSNPLLIFIDDEKEFEESDIKVMIFGKETNGWGNEFNGNIHSTLNEYDTFFNDKKCFQYGGHFWNGMRKFKTMLQSRFPDKKIKIIWNNILKIGKYEGMGFPPTYIHDIESGYFQVITEEIDILKPNAIIFFTGPSYDCMLEEIFGKMEHSPVLNFTIRQMSILRLTNVPFVCRTYHPKYLYFNNIEKYFSNVIAEIDKKGIVGKQN